MLVNDGTVDKEIKIADYVSLPAETGATTSLVILSY